MARKSHEVYCAFCKAPRRIYRNKHTTWTNVLLSLLVGILLMFIVWQEVNPKALVFVFIAMTVSEVFTQVRWRTSIVCQYCGFDPVLYIKNPVKASNKVQLFLEHKKESPSRLLSKHDPFKTLPKRKLKTDKPLISRRV